MWLRFYTSKQTVPLACDLLWDWKYLYIPKAIFGVRYSRGEIYLIKEIFKRLSFLKRINDKLLIDKLVKISKHHVQYMYTSQKYKRQIKRIKYIKLRNTLI